MIPDDQMLPSAGGAIQTSNRAASSPIRARSLRRGVLSNHGLAPAIYDLTALSSQNIEQYVTRAAGMGFNAILSADVSDTIIDAAGRAGLQVYLSLDISTIYDDKVVAAHPDWFTKAHSQIKFVYLSEADEAVAWWDSQIMRWIDLGITGFFGREVAAVPPAIWRHIIANVHAKSQNIQFIASTPGCTPAQTEALYNCGFTFCVSSSCWWDYSAGWLNDESNWLARLAPPIALTCPDANGSTFPGPEQTRRRAVTLAAVFGIGWVMPCGFEDGDGYRLDSYVSEMNKLRIEIPALRAATTAKVISSPGTAAAILTRDKNFMLIANAATAVSARVDIGNYAAQISDSGVSFIAADGEVMPQLPQNIELKPAGTRIFQVQPNKPISTGKKTAPDCNAPRIAIENVTPQVDAGQFPVKRIVGEIVIIEADIIADGHNKLAAEIIFRPITDTKWQIKPMRLHENDRWRGEIYLPRLGRYVYAIRCWKDSFATFADELLKKHNAGIDTHLEISEGIALIERTVTACDPRAAVPLSKFLQKLTPLSNDGRRVALLSKQTAQLMWKADTKRFQTQSTDGIIDAERLGAKFANWYEVFPRSQSNDEYRHGNFGDVINQIPRIAAMGFDVLYFPPIHPIGETNRKGPNNTLTAAKTDPGSPYAIGNEYGGHTAIHPELGTFEDFQRLLAAAAAQGIEIALDFAIQCAPDHPWIKQHKNWFDWRPDGSLRYAENPPKKYEDIVNVDFYAEGATPSLWLALRDVVQFWVEQGVKIFRVDNPHTKPFPFWEWMIGDIRGRNPEVIFLAEAFTRPKIMYRLAKIGFSQSYTYFTWRNTKTELQDYLVELTSTAAKEYFRPHFFVNTPDINPAFLHHSGRPGFLIRAALAATLSGLWGVYNGFELCEAAAMPGKEEYINSEKYQLRAWDYNTANNITAEITQLNKMRRMNRALQSHLDVEFHNVQDDQIIFFSKMAPDGNTILVTICLDPFNAHQSTLEIPLWKFGLPDDGRLWVEDLMHDRHFIWHGKYQPVTLSPNQPYCVWRVQMFSA